MNVHNNNIRDIMMQSTITNTNKSAINKTHKCDNRMKLMKRINKGRNNR